ncbi:MAG: alpha/beta hydrolase [Betaproteobacteria bacterium]
MATLPPIPPALWQSIDEVGPRWATDIRGHSRRMVGGFSAILSGAPKVGNVTRDIAYGAHARQVLDVYAPTNVKQTPVVIFAHGGALIEGDKDRTPEVYANVCWHMTRHDMIGINLEYRLAPEVTYPAVTLDVAAAVHWTREHIAAYGGDPDKIFLFGHSAGALHVGSYAYDQRFHPAAGSGVAGLIVLSGRVRAEMWADNPLAKNVIAYFGADQHAMAQGSMVTHVTANSVPTLIGVAEYENPLIDVHSAELVHRIAVVQRRAPPHFYLARHNHLSSIAQVNTADDGVGPRVVEFVRRIAG